MVNTYSLFGLWKALLGDIQVTWSTARAKKETNVQRIRKKELLIIIALFLTSLFIFIDILSII